MSEKNLNRMIENLEEKFSILYVTEDQLREI
jgi:hypothetical protein